MEIIITQIILLWIGSIIASIGMDIATALTMIKDLADEGYKLNAEKLSEIIETIFPDSNETIFFNYLVFGLNVKDALNRTADYSKEVRPLLLDSLNVLDLLIPMTDEEIKKYSKNPTTINAFKAFIKLIRSEKEEEEDLFLPFIENNELNIIWFKLENNYLIVTKSEGPIANLSITEQTEKLGEVFILFCDNILEKTKIEGIEDLQNHEDPNLNNIIKEELTKLNLDSQFLSKKEQLEELEQIKKEAISLNEKKSPEINTDMNLTKKPK